MALAYSIIPDRWDFNNTNHHHHHQPSNSKSSSSSNVVGPSIQQMRQWVNEWYIPLVHDVAQRRRQQQHENRRAGAPIIRSRRRRTTSSNSSNRHGNGYIKPQGKTTKTNIDEDPTIDATNDPFLLLQMFASYLSKTAEDDPQLSAESTLPLLLQNPQRKDLLWTGLLIAMVRSLGWRARLVGAIEPIPMDLTVNHPLLTSFRYNIFSSTTSTTKTKQGKQQPSDDSTSNIPTNIILDHSIGMLWVEILCVDKNNVKNPYRWFHVDPIHKLINQPNAVESLVGKRIQSQSQQPQQRHVLAYAISVEHTSTCTNNSNGTSPETLRLKLTDVTPRYTQSWIASLRKRGIIRNKNCAIDDLVQNSWWTKTLCTINAAHRPSQTIGGSMSATVSKGTITDPIRVDEGDDNSMEHLDPLLENHENEELLQAASNEAIPTSKAGFKTHPIYVIPSELGKTEALHPDAKQRVCGVFKGQLVYRRSDVSTLHTAKKWLYIGRKVRDSELPNPIKAQTKRKKPPPKGFKALRSYGVGATNDGDPDRQIELGSIPLDDDDDGTDKLYGIWQTDPWSPSYVGPNDDIPTNEFKNIELALLNPGLVHIDQTGLAGVAKKLGIPYAPCLLGFEGHGGNRTPTVRGIVVHAHNEQLIREAGTEIQSFEVEKECSDRRRFLLLQWKRLMVGLLTKDRLEREYGNDDNK
jgi:xeroderma pigmentosum group C-complementing protein